MSKQSKAKGRRHRRKTRKSHVHGVGRLQRSPEQEKPASGKEKKSPSEEGPNPRF